VPQRHRDVEMRCQRQSLLAIRLVYQSPVPERFAAWIGL